MKLNFGIAVLAACCVMAGCNSIEDLISGGHGGQSSQVECEPVGALQLTDLTRVRLASSPFRFVDGATVEGDRLCIGVSYGGGCEEHGFALHVHRETVENSPLRIAAILTHNNNNDMCEALITRQIGFDLTSLKEHLRKVTGQTSGTVLLDISGYNEFKTVEYRF